MKPVACPPPKTRASKRKPQKPMARQLPPPPPPPHGYQPYPPPYPTYYYPYPYPPYQYSSMPPLRPPSSPAPPAKDAATEPRAQPPRLISKDSSSNATEATTKLTVQAEEGNIIPHENDVLMGRGGKNNTHIGNERLREMARAMREVYIKSRKKDKTSMARQLVQQVFALNPPGRFLQRDPVTMVWEEVDLDTARHKTSQCLRDAASEKSSYTKRKPDQDDTNSSSGNMQVEAAANEEPTPVPSTTSTTAEDSDAPISRAMTPVHSNLAHKIVEASPPQPIESTSGHHGVRCRMESWESGSIARNLIESWDDNNRSFHLATRNRRGSLAVESIISEHGPPHPTTAYTWLSSSSNREVADMEMEDAVLIPPEELDGDEPLSLLDVSQLDDEVVPMQEWQPEMYEESESPFDTEFFY